MPSGGLSAARTSGPPGRLDQRRTAAAIVSDQGPQYAESVLAGRYPLGAVALAGGIILLCASPAAGQPEAAAAPTEPPEADDRAAGNDRWAGELGPHAAFQLGVGMLALPAAEACPVSGPNGPECEPAETALGFALQSLARVDNFGFGGGITWAFGLRPTTGAGHDSLERQHSRSYFLVEGHFRYYLPRLAIWDSWVGASMGFVIVNDSWTTLADRDPYADTDFVGPRAVSLRTEGFAAALGAGVDWRFAKRWKFGTHVRYSNWLLPTEREATPLGDLASLAGRVDSLDVGLVVGYLLPI